MTVSGPDNQGSSTRPYLLRALHDWCTDNGFTPYIAVHVDASVRVPAEYVKNNEIVLNVAFEATSGLKLGNQFIEFKARFGGLPREIVVPVDHVVAIYARENGQGMAFPMPAAGEVAPAGPAPAAVVAGPRVPRLAGPSAPSGTPPPSPSKGLRLARPGAEGPGRQRPPPAEPPPSPPDPPQPGAPRPSLKRIK